MDKAYMFAEDKRYLEIHENADGEWDYTLYSYRLYELDGGVIPGFMTLSEALKMVGVLHDLSNPMYELNHDTFMTIVDNKEAI